MKLKIQACLEGKHDDLLNIACSELEGWVLWGGSWEFDTRWSRPGHTGDFNVRFAPPSYTTVGTALDNVHRLVMSKLQGPEGDDSRHRYRRQLDVICDSGRGIGQGWGAIDATALQRVVALLLTLKPEMFEQ